jgi:Zn-dependent protease with chaperone function
MPAPSNTNAPGWIRAGISRQKRGVVTALVLVWTGMPAAIFLAAFGAVFGAIAGGLGAGETGLASSFHINEGAGVAGAFLGAVIGGFFGFAIFFWFLFHNVPGAIGDIVSGVVVAYITLLVLVRMEPRFIRLRGYRELSRREREYVTPILDEILSRMGILDARPALYMSDVVTPGAWTHPRAIVLAEGLLGEYDATEAPPKPDLSRGAIAAILAHEVAHWRDGDAVASRAVWSCFWPFIALFNLMHKIGQARGWLVYFMWIFFWPIWVCLKIITAVMASATREQEYEADAAAAALGEEYRLGLREALATLRDMEPPRTGWEDVLNATHPKIEQRLERLEVNYQPELAVAEEFPLTLTIAGERRTVTISSPAALDALHADDEIDDAYRAASDGGDQDAIARERRRSMESKLRLLQALDVEVSASGLGDADQTLVWLQRGIDGLQAALDGASAATQPAAKPPPAAMRRKPRPQPESHDQPLAPAAPKKPRSRAMPEAPEPDADAQDRWAAGFAQTTRHPRAPRRPPPPPAPKSR